ncbi:MAG: S41 family peptidase [Planctomycetes bacterium]|nr:S41 family peptidase [Planctomycetota bacterium]
MFQLGSLLVALAVSAPAVLASSSAQGKDDSSVDARAIVEHDARAAKDWKVEDIWLRVETVNSIVPAKDLAAAVDAQLRAENLEPHAALFLGSLRIAGEDPDASKLVHVLEPLLQSGERDVAVAAANLLADAEFRTLAGDERDELVDRLQQTAEKSTVDPEVNLAAAHAWYQLGNGDDRRQARARMTEFLTSNDANLRAQGALALARSNAEITGVLYDELKKLAGLPGERGRLADAYLETERVREQTERLLRQRVNTDDASKRGKETPEQAQFRTVMSMIQSWHIEGDHTKKEDLLAAALNGMLQSMDEHSTYFTGKSYARFEQDLEAGYGGIGAYVGDDPDDGLFTITHPIYSGPAYRAGLASDDKIVRVDEWPTLRQPSEEVIKRLKGRPGTKVKLYIWRRGMDRSLIDRPTEDMAVEVVRESITIPAVASQMLPGNIGMLVLQDFSRVATTELRAALKDLLAQGATSIVFDLRNNGGGLLDESVGVAGLFLPKGTLVVSTENRIEGKEKFLTTSDPIVPADMPVSVLVNRFTASASEIVSGALQDHKRALIIGKRSFGKGSVQNLIKVPGLEDDEYEDENGNNRHDNWEKLTKDSNGNGEFDFAPRVKLTIARYLLPSGRSIHRELDKDGNIQSDGGVLPELDLDLRHVDSWRIEEMVRIQRLRAVRDYVDATFPAGGELSKKELMQSLADNDHRDTSKYPGFDAFVQKLNTPLPADDVRMLVRAEIRRRVQDQRGKEYPQGDFVEDEQLQEAIRVALKAQGKKPGDLPEYQSNIPSESLARMHLRGDEKVALRDALKELDLARKSDGKLSAEALESLSKLLENNLDGK